MGGSEEDPTRADSPTDAPVGPAVEKRAGEITEEDAWVSVIGTVISRNPNSSSITIDDGSGQVDVRYSMIPELGSLVRVIGMVVASEEKILLEAIIVQDFSCFDVDLYRRIVKLEEGVFSREGDYHQ